MSNKCLWGCGHDYVKCKVTEDVEQRHLLMCPIYQGLTVADVQDGKEFVALPGFPHILVERPKAN